MSSSSNSSGKAPVPLQAVMQRCGRAQMGRTTDEGRQPAAAAGEAKASARKRKAQAAPNATEVRHSCYARAACKTWAPPAMHALLWRLRPSGLMHCLMLLFAQLSMVQHMQIFSLRSAAPDPQDV